MKLSAPLKFAVGVNNTSVPTIWTVPPTAFVTLVMVSVWPLSLAGPVLSLPSSVANGLVRVPESSATLDSASSVAVGASLTSVMVKLKLAVALDGALTPAVVPLSWTV